MLRLQFERIERNFSQTELCNLTEIRNGTISAFERGRMNPTAAELDLLADILEVSPPEALVEPVMIAETVKK